MQNQGERRAGGEVLLISRRVPPELAAHARGPRALVVSNAADPVGPEYRAQKADRDMAGLRAAGFTPVPVDLRRHTESGAKLGALLAQADLLWVGGGNTFWLLELMHRTGLSRSLPTLLAAGLSYAGESAGAVAWAPVLDQVDTVDDPRVVPRPAAVRGLGLVDFLPWPHWTPRGPVTLREQERHAPMPGVRAPVWRLRDGEYLYGRWDPDLSRPGPMRLRQADTTAMLPTLF